MWRMQLEESMQSPPFELIDIVVRAGAGAGKTTELTERVLKLAQDFQKKNQRYPHFVVTTFTRKATQELKERLMKEAMKRQDPGLIGFLKRPSQLHISTIHGILSLFLAKFGSMMGLSPKLIVVSDSRERQQIKRLIRDLCQKDAEFNLAFQSLLENCEFKDLQDALGTYFRLKLQFGEIPFFGPEDFEAHLSEKKRYTLQVMKSLAEAIRSSEAPEAWQELAGYCESAAIHPNFQVMLENLPGPRKSKTVPESVIELRDELKNQLGFFENWRVTKEFEEIHESMCGLFFRCADSVTEALREAKLFSGEITMQDLETLSLTLIRQNPEAASAFSKQWDYWLVDEYQDTSPVQVELLRALSGESKSFVVGDPQQSIYLFRGARSEVFTQRETDVEKRKGVLFSKLTNYRSKPELLEFFNFFFSKLSPQFQKMKPKAEPMKNPVLPSAEFIEVPEDKASDRDVELEAVLYRCQELMAQAVPLEKICVLFRSNKDLEDLAWMAQEFGIAVQAQSAGQFFEQREVIDALALLKFLCNPHDNRNLLQILRSPLFRIKDQFLYEWCQEAGSSYWLTFIKASHPVLTELQTFLASVQEKGVGSVWREILVQKRYFHFAQALDPSGKREANLWKLIHMVRSEERKPGFSYLEFLKDLDVRALSTEDSDESEAVPVIEPQRIHLMTVHASKGLQFAHVILPRMGKVPPPVHPDFFLADEQTGRWTLSLIDPEEGKKVASLSGIGLLDVMKRRQKEEEDRVLYVALTRAEETVTLIWQEGPRSESWAGRLKMDLTSGMHSESCFAYQVRRGSFQPQKQAAALVTAGKEQTLFRKRDQASGQTLSVTEILEVETKSGSTAPQREMADVQKAVTGVDVHRLFESLKYKWMKEPGFDWQTWLPELPVSHQKALQFLAGDSQGRWFEIIRNGEVEFGMAVKMGASLLQGQIDLWGRDESGQAWVVDYKTGSSRYQDKAFQQLEIYLWALKKMKKIGADEKVQLAVIYPFAEKTIVRPSSGWQPPG
jgi:ATP-dependent helicase/nuclease subunit A